VVSRVRRERQQREAYVQSLFSSANLQRKVEVCLPPDQRDQGLQTLARLDHLPAVTATAEQYAGLVVGAKLRALYLSGGDLASLERAVDMAMHDHRDLDMVSETDSRFDVEWAWTSRAPRVASDVHSGFDELIDWLGT